MSFFSCEIDVLEFREPFELFRNVNSSIGVVKECIMAWHVFLLKWHKTTIRWLQLAIGLGFKKKFNHEFFACKTKSTKSDHRGISYFMIKLLISVSISLR